MYVGKKRRLIDFSRFSSWFRLLPVTERVFQAVDGFCKRNCSLLERKVKTEELILRNSQTISFNSERLALMRSKTISKDNKIITISPFLDDNILSAGGGLGNYSEGGFSSNPIILDAKEFLARLLIKYYQEKLYHDSHATVINKM